MMKTKISGIPGILNQVEAFTNLSTQGRSSAIYPIISSDIIGQITENKTECSGSTTGTAGSTACEAKQDKDVVTVVIKRSSTFFLGQNNLFI